MKRITYKELQERITNANGINYCGHTKSDNPIRHGSYITLLNGLGSTCWFYGIDLTTEEFIVELVG